MNMSLIHTVFNLVLTNTVIISPMNHLRSRSLIECMKTCFSLQWCLALSYSKLTNNCTLSNIRYSLTDTINLVPASGSQYYHIKSEFCPVALSYVLVREPVSLCYKVRNENTWQQNQGKTECNNDGGALITLDTQGKNEFMVKELKKLNTSILTYVYIGLEEIDSVGNWVWPSGAGVSFTNWFPPNEPGAQGGEECTVLIASRNFTWSDVVCTLRGHVICEIGLP